jgi:hypothetical protein
MKEQRIKFYLVETEYNETTSIVDVLQNELDANRSFAKEVLENGKTVLTGCEDPQAFADILVEIYPMLFSVTTKLSVAAEILNVKTLDEYDVFCKNFLEKKIDIVDIADTICYTLSDVIFGDEEKDIKCLNFNEVEKIVEDIKRAVESPLESLKSGNKWMSMSPTEMVSLTRFLFPAYEAMRERKEAGTDSYLLCMPI